MTRHLWNLSFVVLLTTALNPLTPAARGELVATLTVDVTAQADGWKLYEYTLANLSNSTLPVVEFDLAVAVDADLQDVAGPAGWSFDYTTGGESVSFFADAADAELAPGTTGLFSFLSRLAPVASDYVVVGSAPPSIGFVEGQVGSPGAAVPEPSSLVLAGLALSALGLARGPRPAALRIS